MVTTAQQLTQSPKTFRERDDWMRAVLAADLPDACVRVAITIALHLRVTTGQCNPSYPTLAAESHVSERSTYRLVDLLEHRGWIAVTRLSGRVNQYTLLTTANSVAGVTTAKPVAVVPLPNREPTPAKSSTEPLPNRGGTPANMLAGKKRRTAKRTAKEESESRAPDFASPGSEEKKEDSRRKKTKKAAKPKPPDSAESFERFWRAYPRRVAKDAAARAFARAVENGTDPEVLIAGAQTYAVLRQNEDQKYTKHPATWLNGGCWTDEMPSGAVIDEQGNVVAIEQPQQQTRQSGGFVATAEALAEEAERAMREGRSKW
jgi:hypothetical protein